MESREDLRPLGDRLIRAVKNRAKVALNWTFDTGNGIPRFVLRTTLVSFAAVAVLTIPALLMDPDNVFSEWDDSYFSFVVLALVLAPLVENIVLVGTIEFLDAVGCKDRTIIAWTSFLSGAVHAVSGGWQFIAGLTFASMTYAYLLYRRELFSKRYLITVSQHVLFNTPATILMGWSES